MLKDKVKFKIVQSLALCQALFFDDTEE